MVPKNNISPSSWWSSISAYQAFFHYVDANGPHADKKYDDLHIMFCKNKSCVPNCPLATIEGCSYTDCLLSVRPFGNFVDDYIAENRDKNIDKILGNGKENNS